MLVQPVGQPPEPLGLPPVHLGVAFGVVAHEDLAERRIELLDVVAELVAVLEVELVLSTLLHRHGQVEPFLLGPPGDVRTELLVNEDPAGLLGRPLVDGLLKSLEDHRLGVGDGLGLLRVGLARDAEELLLERAPVVEGEDVEIPVVSERHGSLLVDRSRVRERTT